MGFPVVTIVHGFNYFEMIFSNVVLLSVEKKPLGLVISHFGYLLLKSCLGMNIILLDFSRLALPDKTGHILFFPVMMVCTTLNRTVLLTNKFFKNVAVVFATKKSVNDFFCH